MSLGCPPPLTDSLFIDYSRVIAYTLIAVQKFIFEHKNSFSLHGFRPAMKGFLLPNVDDSDTLIYTLRGFQFLVWFFAFFVVHLPPVALVESCSRRLFIAFSKTQKVFRRHLVGFHCCTQQIPKLCIVENFIKVFRLMLDCIFLGFF